MMKQMSVVDQLVSSVGKVSWPFKYNLYHSYGMDNVHMNMNPDKTLIDP